MDFWRRRSHCADDSGIDSDEEHRAAHNLYFVNDFMQVSDSSSDEDGLQFPFRMPTVRVNHKGRTIDNGSDCSEEPDDSLDQRYEGPERVCDHNLLAYCDVHGDYATVRNPEADDGPKAQRHLDDDGASENGQDSPSLLEVELTASDEDDDASVLELVIPLQQSVRYQRVSTSKPKSSKRGAWIFSIAFWCCVRKRSE